MADLPVRGQNWLVSPNKDVEDMWKQTKIQEHKSALAATKRSILEFEQKIEDIQKGLLIGLKAKEKMLIREVAFLEEQLASGVANEVIDV